MFRKVLASLAACASITAAAQVTTVFGLPLGGKLTQSPPQCPAKLEQRAQLCWVALPARSTGGTIGIAFIPERDTPAWAQLPRVELGASGVLQRLSFKVAAADGQASFDSITKRFGAPSRAGTLDTGTTWSEWDSPQLVIRRICTRAQTCSVEFSSRAAWDAAAQRQQDAARQRTATP